jgi:hypothetical protein
VSREKGKENYDDKYGRQKGRNREGKKELYDTREIKVKLVVGWC